MGERRKQTLTLPEEESKTPATSDRVLVNAGRLAEILSVELSTIRWWTFAHKIPVVRLGKYRRYNPEAVIEALNKVGNC